LGAGAYGAFDPEAAAVGFYDVLGDGEAETRAADFAGAGCVHAVEAFEDALLIGERDADASVCDGDDGVVIARDGSEIHAAAGRSVLHGVVEEILENFAEEAGIATHGGKLGRIREIEGDIALAGFEESGGGAAFDEFSDGDGLVLDIELSRFDAGKLQEIVGEAAEARGVITNDFEEAAIIFFVLERTAEQRFGEALDGGERRFEFVGDIGDEILADALESAELGDVVKHDDGAIRRGLEGFDRRGGDGEAARHDGADDEAALKIIRAGERAAGEIEQVSLADEFDERAAFESHGIKIQNFGEGAIAEDDALFRVNDGNAFNHAAQDGA